MRDDERRRSRNAAVAVHEHAAVVQATRDEV
jgi:hypothetical protein